MPANRLRTTSWRKYLQQLCDRNGSLQITIAPSGRVPKAFLWNVVLVDLTSSEIIVEAPTTVGEPILFDLGLRLLGIMSIGQNRWMFRTRSLGITAKKNRGKTSYLLKLSMPLKVERCQRRRDYRISTDTLELPEATLWPLLDPRSALLPEQVCKANFNAYLKTNKVIKFKESLPIVGPPSVGIISNIGGGGIGLQINGSGGFGIGKYKFYWLQFQLGISNSPPLGVNAKLMHHHLEAGDTIYAGMMFDFSFNPSHRKFIGQQISNAIAMQQRVQLKMAS